MNYIYKTDNYDELLKTNELVFNLRKYVTTRLELRKEFDSNNNSFINGTIELDESVINCDFDDTFGIEDITLVHATDLFPENGIIKPATNIIYTENNIQFLSNRYTTHFALNGRVGNHEYGNWDTKKIVIIDPIINHMNDIVNFNTVDTYFEGEVKISNQAIILVHESIYDEIPKEILSQYKIIKFTGNNKTATEKMLLILGYKPQTICKNTWQNPKNEDKVYEYIKQKYPQIPRDGMHAGSIHSLIENYLQKRDKYLAIIRNVNFIDTSNNFYDISIEEIKKLWYNYIYGINNNYAGFHNASSEELKKMWFNFIKNETTRIKQINFENFFIFCMQHGIVPEDNNKCIALNSKNTVTEFKNRDKILKENYHLFHQLYEQILIDRLDNIFDTKLLDAYNNWYQFYYNKIKEKDLSNEEIEKRIKIYLINALKTNIEQYKYKNDYRVRLLDDSKAIPNEENEIICFTEITVNKEIEKRIDNFIEEKNKLAQEFINYIVTSAPNSHNYNDIYEMLEIIYCLHCQHYGDLDNIHKESGAKAILMYQMKKIFTNYANDNNYFITNNKGEIIKKYSKAIIDIEIKKIIDEYIASKRINNEKHTR